MTTLRVHFDGKVLVPEGPVNLPRNKSVEVHIPDEREVPQTPLESTGFDLKNGIPVFRVPKDAKIMTADDVRAIEDDAD